MKKARLLAASLFIIALAGCGGGGDSNVVAGANDNNGGTTQTNGSVVQTNGSDTQTQFPLRGTKQGDERTYETEDTYSDGSKYTYSRRTVQAVLNADGTGERLVFDGSNRLISTEIRTYDENGLLSRYFVSTGITCKYNARRNSFTSPARIGQSFVNKLTDTCDNGYTAVIDEKGTIVGAETITVHGMNYSTLKAVITETGVVTPPSPAPAYQYTLSRTEWIEPTLGLIVKEVSAYTLAPPPDAIYNTARSVTLKSFLNK